MRTPQEIADTERDLRQARGDVEAEWSGIEKHQLVKRSEFRKMMGNTSSRAIYDTTAAVARKNLAAALYGQSANPASRWFELSVADDDMARWQPVKDWLYKATTKILLSLGPSVSAFYGQAPVFFEQLCLRGHTSLFSAIRPEVGKFHDETLDLWDVCLVYNEFGELTEFYRRMILNKQRAQSLFGENTPKKVMDETSKQKTFTFIHAVYRDADYTGGFGRKSFTSQYVWADEPEDVQSGGYREMPLFAPRWDTISGADYGFGPGLDALLSQAQLNTYDRANAILAARQANPPVATTTRLTGESIRLAPGQVTYGALSQNGNPLVREIYQTSQPGMNLEMADQKREAVKDAYYFSLMQLSGRSGMSATEVLEIMQERARLFAPHTGRVQAEGLTKLIIYRFNRLYEAGQINREIPAEMQGQQLKVVYTSPFAKAQQMAEADAATRAMQAIGAIEAQFPNMGLSDNIDGDAFVHIIQQGYGAPPMLLRKEADRDEIRAQRLQQAQMAQMAALGEQGGRAIQSISQAQANIQRGAA